MNTSTAEGTWKDIKGKIRAKFGKLTDDDVEGFKGNMDQMVGKIQKVYGYAKDRAEQEYNELKASFTHSVNPSMERANEKASELEKASKDVLQK